MNIGFDSKRLFNNKTGLGNYSRTLVKNLLKFYPEEKYFLYTPSFDIEDYKDTFAEYSQISTRTSGSSHDSHWRSFGIKKEIEKDNIDVYHGLSHELPRNNDKLSCKKIVTVHDLIFKRFPEYFPIIDRTFYGLKCRHCLNTADKIIAISQSTKEDIIHYFDIEESKIEVVYQACQDIYYQNEILEDAPFELPSVFNLSVGTLEARKNVESLIAAYSILPKDLQVPLIIIGTGKEYKKKVQRMISTLGLSSTISIHDGISQLQLVYLYRNAHALLYPSHYEGFGLPVAEALLSKTPVLTSANSSLPEAGGENSIYIDSKSVDSIKEGLETIISDEEKRAKMIDSGYAYARSKFNPKSLTEQLHNIYKS